MTNRSNRTGQSHFLGLAFLVTFLAIGLLYWPLPYHSVNLPDALFTPALWLVPFGALLLRLLKVAPWWLATLVMAAPAPVAVLARIIVECSLDPTSHNLWPFEIILTLFVSVPLALLGAAAGAALARSVKSSTEESR